MEPPSHPPDNGSQLQDVEQQHQRPVPAEVAVDEDEAELDQDARQESEEERQRLPNAVTSRAVGAAQIQGDRRLGHEEEQRDEDGAREFHGPFFCGLPTNRPTGGLGGCKGRRMPWQADPQRRPPDAHLRLLQRRFDFSGEERSDWRLQCMAARSQA